MKYLIIFFIFFVQCKFILLAHDIQTYSYYDIQLEIQPKNQYIKVDGNLQYIVDSDSLNTIEFKLHKNLLLSEFLINGEENYFIDSAFVPVRWQPDAKRIVCNLNRFYHQGESINFQFSYEGKITSWPEWSANVIDTGWIEIGLYFPWYPNFYGEFTYNLKVSIDKDYNVFAPGNSKKNENLYEFENKKPVGDFIVCASKDLKIYESSFADSKAILVNSHLSKSTTDSIISDVTKTYQKYMNWFGELDDMNMNIIISKRTKGGGYARKGALYLGGMNDTSYQKNKSGYLRYLSHEISHFWWNKAGHNWEDWLNESFAEYSALMIIRELKGEEEFKSRIEEKRSGINELPPIWNMDRNDPNAEKLLYNKGTVLLKKLEDKIGKEDFIAICKDRLDLNLNTTEDFLNHLKEKQGIETEKWFRKLLQK